ncbi:hypothetical protein BGZ65_006316, partial [Modicella reniformis]
MELEDSTIATIPNNTIATQLDQGTAALVNELTTAVKAAVAEAPIAVEVPIETLTAAIEAPIAIATTTAAAVEAVEALIAAAPIVENEGNNQGAPAGLEDIKRTQCGVRWNEYAILVHVYRQLLTLPNDACKIPPDEASKVGRRPKVIDENYGIRIKEIVDRMNRDSIPASAVRIQAALKNEFGIEVTLTMLRRDLLRLGLKWVE